MDSALVAAAIGLGSKWGTKCQAKQTDNVNVAAHRFNLYIVLRIES